MTCAICSHCGSEFEKHRSEKVCFLKCSVLSRTAVSGENDCWEWLGSIGSHGYGVFSFRGIQYTTHRASYLAHKGEIPSRDGGHGGVVMHSCDNRPCVNPSHLSAGSQGENLEDAENKGRMVHAGPRGELSRTAILTAEKVMAIRGRLSAGETGRALANEYGVTPSTISSIKTGKIWKHI